MRRLLVGGAAAVLFAFPAAAMDVATFLRHADSLERMGVSAMFAAEGKLVMSELNDSNRALRDERNASKAAGRNPVYCPEKHERASPQEIIVGLRKVPIARRSRLQVRDALRAFYAQRYPCAGS